MILTYILLIIFWALCSYVSIKLYLWQFKDITKGMVTLHILTSPIGLIAGIINYLIEKNNNLLK